MLKKLSFLLILFILCGFSAFSQEEDEGEEVGFLLFMPNSSDTFVNERQATVQLDRVARFLRGRNLAPGQIYVYGYTADFQNNIEPEELSRNRASFIISELQKRGVAEELFADPIAYGAVQIWDDETIADSISLNRRVRILLHGEETPTLVTMDMVVDSEIETAEVAVSAREEENGPGFPWWLLLLLLLPLLAFLLLRNRKPGERPAKAPKPPKPPKPVPAPKPTPSPFLQSGKPKSAELLAAETESGMNLEDLIRRRAYQLYEQRGYTHGCHDEDWYNAERDILEWYERYKKDKSIGLPFGLTW